MAKIKDEQLAKINELKGKFNELTFLIGQNKINQTNLKVEEEEMFGELARLGIEEQNVLSEIQKFLVFCFQQKFRILVRKQTGFFATQPWLSL